MSKEEAKTVEEAAMKLRIAEINGARVMEADAMQEQFRLMGERIRELEKENSTLIGNVSKNQENINISEPHVENVNMNKEAKTVETVFVKISVDDNEKPIRPSKFPHLYPVLIEGQISMRLFYSDDTWDNSHGNVTHWLKEVPLNTLIGVDKDWRVDEDIIVGVENVSDEEEITRLALAQKDIHLESWVKGYKAAQRTNQK